MARMRCSCRCGGPWSKVTRRNGSLFARNHALRSKEGFEVIFEKGPNLVVEDKIIPLASRDATIAAADDVKAWFVVAAI